MKDALDPVMKIQRVFGYVWGFLVFFPAACVLLVFPLAPDYFESMAIRANGLLDVIEFGRSKPWIVFTGMPYPAMLRLLGDVSGIVAVLAFLIIMQTMLVIVLTKNPKLRGKMNDIRRKIYARLDSKGWVKEFFLGFFLISTGMFVIFKYYIMESAIRVTISIKLAIYVCLASGVPGSLLIWVTFYIMFLSWFFRRSSKPVS